VVWGDFVLVNMGNMRSMQWKGEALIRGDMLPEGEMDDKVKAIARILKEEGYISNFKATDEEGKKILRLYLKYGPNNETVINSITRVSRPGCRVYVGHNEIRRVLGGLGINILTTPKGVMTGRQARKEGVGGEILCEIY